MFRRTALAALALLGLAALTHVEPAQAIPPRKPLAPIIFERATQPAPNGRPQRGAIFTPDLVIRADGTWRADSATGRPDGRLDRSALAELTRAIARARYRIDYGMYPMCTGFPSRRIRIKTTAGTVTWAAPCARRPHASVLALETLAGELTLGSLVPVEPVVPIDPVPPGDPLAPLPGDPLPIVPVEPVVPVTPVVTPPTPSDVLVRLTEMRLHGTGKAGGNITIRVDGAWSSDGGSGVLAPGALAALRARIATVTVGPSAERYQCAARLDGHGAIEILGRGRHQWSIPCSSLHPSLAALITEIRQLTR